MMLGAKLTRKQCQWKRFSHLRCQRQGWQQDQEGFVLPIALGLGFVMVLLGITVMIRSQTAQTIAYQRSHMGSSLLTSEGGVARTLMYLSQLNNAPLLTRNYDSINPNTGTTYLGPDGIPNNGDEGITAVDEWSGFSASTVPCATTASPGSPSMSYSGAIGVNGQYALRAYRYNASQKTGTFLVEGQQGGSESLVAVTIVIDSVVPDFPGVVVLDAGTLRGRRMIGTNANVYYDPIDSGNISLSSGFAGPANLTRADYLDALWSGPADNFVTDTIDGKIVACPLSLSWPHTLPAAPVEALGVLNGDRTLSGVSGSIKFYQASQLDLNSSDTITVDTTDGPVYLYLAGGPLSMRGASRIVNVRTDGKLPQVGDLRIIVAAEEPIDLFDTVCIQTAFIYNPESDLHLQTTGDGCSSSGETNIDGVVWVEDVVNTVNSVGGRASDEDVELSVTTSGVTAGIAVPNDVSSLSDLFGDLNLPTFHRFGGVKTWQRVQM